MKLFLKKLRLPDLLLVLIVAPIAGYAMYLDTRDFFVSVISTIGGGLLAYFIGLPLLCRFSRWFDSKVGKLIKKLE